MLFKIFLIEYSMSNQRMSTIHVHFQFNEISKRRYYTHTNQTFTNKSCLWAQWTFSVLYFGLRLVIWEMPSHVFLHYCCMAQHTTATEHIPDKEIARDCKITSISSITAPVNLHCSVSVIGDHVKHLFLCGVNESARLQITHVSEISIGFCIMVTLLGLEVLSNHQIAANGIYRPSKQLQRFLHLSLWSLLV